MNITVSGKGLDIGQALPTRVQDKLLPIVTKYFDNPIEMTVIFSRENDHYFRCDVSVQTERGEILRGEAKAGNIDLALDAAADTTEKRLRRYKSKIRDHHRKSAGRDVERGQKYILAATHPGDGGEDADLAAEPEAPAIIAEMNFIIETLSVADAVMRMELGDQPALLFRNAGHGELNMIFRRPDGNISWIDPKGQGRQTHQAKRTAQV